MADTTPAISEQRLLHIALIGPPNAGKSTLLNQLVGEKVSIVTPKPQTTRTRISGITHYRDAQMIFLDTPGLSAPSGKSKGAKMISHMHHAAWDSLEQADAVVVVIDASRLKPEKIGEFERFIFDELKKRKKKPYVLLNKVDLVKKPLLLVFAEMLFKENLFEAIWMVSSKTGDGVQDILSSLYPLSIQSPWIFDKDQTADIPIKFLAAELTREQLFLGLKQELPYDVAVETEKFEKKKRKTNGRYQTEYVIHQAIWVSSENHKRIIVGASGSFLKSVGSAARKEIAKSLGSEVHLFLFVKVREDWQNSNQLSELIEPK